MHNRRLLGAVLVALGLVFLADRAGVTDAGTLLAAWWPVVFVLAAVLALRDRPPRPVAAATSAVIGLVLLSVTTGLVSTTVLALFWPIVLIAVGVWFLLGRRVHRTVVDSGDAVTATVLFSGHELVNASPQLQGGTITALFGGVDLNLVRAMPAPDAVLDVTVLFGGVDVTVPDDWRVLIDGPAVFGGYENHAAPTDPAAPTLRIRAFAMFGGIEVKTTPRAAPAVEPSAVHGDRV